MQEQKEMSYINETSKGYEIDYVKLIKYLQEQNYIFYNEMPYVYDNGIYKLLSVNDFCNRILPNNGAGKTLQEKQKIMERCFVTDLLRKSVDETNQMYINDKTHDISNYEPLNCKNCVILIRKTDAKLKICPHDSRNVFFQQIPYNFNKEAVMNEFDELYIDNIRLNGEENVQLMFEMLGSIIGRICDKSIFNILGRKDSGKTVLTKVIEELVGTDFCTRFNSKSLYEDNKEIHQMLNAYVNLGDEDELDFSHNSTFLKRLSGGGVTIPFYVKFRKEPIKGVFKTKLLFTSNEPISINYTTKDIDALKARLVVLPLDKSVPKQQQVLDIEKKLNYEYWLLQSIKSLCRLIQNNFKYTECKNVDEFYEVDEFSEWVSSCIEITDNKDDYVLVKELYTEYREFCLDNVCTCMAERVFGKKLSQILNRKSVVKKIKGRTYRIYTGVKLIEESIFEEGYMK